MMAAIVAPPGDRSIATMRVCLVSGFAEQLYSLCAHDEEALTLLRILDLASQDLRVM